MHAHKHTVSSQQTSLAEPELCSIPLWAAMAVMTSLSHWGLSKRRLGSECRCFNRSLLRGPLSLMVLARPSVEINSAFEQARHYPFSEMGFRGVRGYNKQNRKIHSFIYILKGKAHVVTAFTSLLAKTLHPSLLEGTISTSFTRWIIDTLYFLQLKTITGVT